MSVEAIDCTFPPNREAMRRAGIDGKIRYVGPYRKAAGPAEIRADRLDPTLVRGYVIEGAADDALKGYKLGFKRAQQANAALDAAGEPLTTPVGWACDTSCPGAATLPFGRGFRAGSKRPAYCYGSAGVIDANFDAGNVIGGWQTNAHGWDQPRRTSPHASVHQLLSAHLPGIGYVDPDVIDDGSPVVVWPHGHPGAPAPHPVPGPIPFPGHALRRGAVSHDVAVFSLLLRGAGYHGFSLTPLHAAESYGIGKWHAVRRFQKRHHLVVDGIVGAKTWAAVAAQAARKQGRS